MPASILHDEQNDENLERTKQETVVVTQNGENLERTKQETVAVTQNGENLERKKQETVVVTQNGENLERTKQETVAVTQNGENLERKKQETVADKPWTVTLHPNKQIWKEANFNIYGFIHYVHFLLPCTATPELCHNHASNSTNNCNFP